MSVRILVGDCRDVLRTLPDTMAQCCVTSPPYFGLRDYGVAGQIGLEPTPDDFVCEMVAVFREVRRVLRDNGTLWLNLGDSYASRPNGTIGMSGLDGSFAPHAETRRANALRKTGLAPGLKHKDLIGIPWRVAFALQADGWYLRSAIVWAKPNPMPESVTDRPTSAYEMVFLLSKSERYHYDADAIREGRTSDEDANGFRGGAYTGGNIDNDTVGKRTAVGNKRVRGVPPRHAGYETSDQSGLDSVPRGAGRNARNVWTIATRPFPEAHFATFPPELAERCILAGCPAGGTVLDPFGGAGTTGLVADRLQRDAILVEINPEYAAMAERRVAEARMGPVTRSIARGCRAEQSGALPLFQGAGA